MKQKDKELLLKDLCARLLYEVICKVEFKDGEGWKTQNMSLKGVFIDKCYFTTDTGSIYSKEFKPYFRPMLSMTKEEGYEFYEISGFQCYDDLFTCKKLAKKQSFIGDTLDWLNSHHFDYRGLIEKGLALEAPEGMYDLSYFK